ncbi:MAG: 50S ribosomal protein L11 methyltransferase [Desulfobaccales bacterium]
MPFSYTFSGFGKIIFDDAYRLGYQQAIRQVVMPGDVVLDLGCGSGLLGLLACKCGARRVYAIEVSDIIHLAENLAVANGYADRIEYIKALSTQVSLPERVDVMISDLRGVLPFFGRHIPAVVDARKRFLAPGGRMLPQRDLVWAALLESPKAYNALSSPWDGHGYGLDLRAARDLAVNNCYVVRPKAGGLLAAPRTLTVLDYDAVESPDVQGKLSWEVSRAGVGHGLVLWFDSILAPGVEIANAPGSFEEPNRLIYGNFLCPWPEPVNLAAGDVVSVDLAANLVGDEYIWRWDTRILDQGQPGRLKGDFRQSTLLSAIVSPAKLRRIAHSHVPDLSRDGQIDRLILGLMDGNNSLGEIARQVAAEFPARFSGEGEALARVGKLSLEYGRPLDNKYLLKDI